MRSALGLIACQQGFRVGGVQRFVQFPAEVMGIAQPAIHPLAGEGRRQMRRVAGKENAPVAPAFRHPGVKGIDLLATDRFICIRADHSQKFPRKFRRFGLLDRFAPVQLEFIAADSGGAGQGDAGALRPAEDLGVETAVAGGLEVKDQPGLFEGRSHHLDPQVLAHEGPAAITGNQVSGGHLLLGAIRMCQGCLDLVRSLRHRGQFGPEQVSHRFMAGHRPAQQSHEIRLLKGIALVKTVILGKRLDGGKDVSLRTAIDRAIAADTEAGDLLMQADRLQGAQGFVVDRHRPRFAHDVPAFFDKQGGDPHVTQNIGQQQSGRPGPDDQNICRKVGRPGHGACSATMGLRSTPRLSISTSTTSPGNM